MSGWGQTTLLMGNIRTIKEFIETEKPVSVNIFSFAIQTKWDIHGFNEHVRPFVERELDIKFSSVPDTDWIEKQVMKTMKIQVLDFTEMCNLFGKQWAFIHAMHKGTHVLFDDMVEDCTFQNANKNLRLIKV